MKKNRYHQPNLNLTSPAVKSFWGAWFEAASRHGDEEYLERAAADIRTALNVFVQHLTLVAFDVLDSESVVYYLRRANGDIKIGYTKSLHSRKRTLERRHGPLDLLAWEPGGAEMEAERHGGFAAWRISYPEEWFKPAGSLLLHVATLASEVRRQGLELFPVRGAA